MTTLATSPMAYTIFQNVQGTKKVQKNGTWGDLIRLMNHPPAYLSKQNCPLIKLATFGDERSPKGSFRTDKNMLTITGIEGDYDGEKVPPEEAVTRLKAVNVEAIVYTTPSHTPGKPRWRVLVPLSKPFPPDERERFVALLNGALGGILNVESFTQSQSFYYGRVSR